MKKAIYIFLLSLLLLTAACGPAEGGAESASSGQAIEESQNPDEENISEEIIEDDIDEEDIEEEDNFENNEEQVTYLYEVSDNLAYINVIEAEESNEPIALLTFDDAPDKNALEIADILEEYDAPAIFFVNGIFIDRDNGEENLLELHERGFAIGNHGYSHKNLQSLSEEEQYEEIISTSDRIEEITGERPRFFRAPYGQNTEFSIKTALEDGMVTMNWTYGYDWEADYQNPDSLADIMLNTELLISGANLLMHDREWTRQATPKIIEGLQEQDYELVDPDLIRSPGITDQEESEGDN